MLLFAGCERKSAAPPYQFLEGTVAERHSDTGELQIALAPPRRGAAEPLLAFCLVTKDSELYIDDVLGQLDDVQPGDRIDLVVYRDPNPRMERFIVSYGYIRPLRPPAAAADGNRPVDALAPTAKEP